MNAPRIPSGRGGCRTHATPVVSALATLALWVASVAPAFAQDARGSEPPARLFQTDQSWSPRVNVPADMVLAYGLNDTLPARIADWRAHGYRVGVMTALAWGDYPAYVAQVGDTLSDEVQQGAGGHALLHSGPQVPYFVPTARYVRFIVGGIERALASGAEAVYLEEPEFWAQAGWSPAFRKAWQVTFNAPWQPPDASPQAQARASQLKVQLFRDAVVQICAAVHAWGQAHARGVPCNVATHSLLNYAQWGIVSPEHAFIGAGVDGLIGQVWTGTARAPNYYRGVRGERTFATGFLEYAALGDLAQALDVQLWLLADPVEDNPEHTWRDYRDNWQATLIASLLQPHSARFEVLPWPNRVFGLDARYRQQGGGTSTIPADYQQVLETVFHALAQMPAEGAWLHAGTQNIGVLTSDSMLFQRAAPVTSDPLLGDVYGLALPLLLHGMPVTPVGMETALHQPQALSQYRLLLLSDHAQQAPQAQAAQVLADWVRSGGALMLVDDPGDAHAANTAPREALFKALGVTTNAAWPVRVGRGVVTWLHASPVALSHAIDGATQVLAAAQQAAAQVGLAWKQSPALVMRRGAYIVAAGLDGGEVPASAAPLLTGRFLDLLQPDLPEVTQLTLQPGQQRLLLDLDADKRQAPRVLAAAGQTTPLQISDGHARFELSGIEARDAADVANVVLALSQAPQRVTLDGKALSAEQYHYQHGLLRLRLAARAQAQQIDITLAGAQ